MQSAAWGCSNDHDVLGFVCLDYVVFYCLIDNHDSDCVGAFCTSDPSGFRLSASQSFEALNTSSGILNRLLVNSSSSSTHCNGAHVCWDVMDFACLEYYETCHSVTFICIGQFTPKMKANAEPRLLSSLV